MPMNCNSSHTSIPSGSGFASSLMHRDTINRLNSNLTNLSYHPLTLPMNYNSPHANISSGSGFGPSLMSGDTINHLNSNLMSNPANQMRYTSPPVQATIPTMWHSQQVIIPQRHNLSFGTPGPRMTEVRSHVTPPIVQMQSMENYFPYQNLLDPFSLTEVRVFKVQTTQFLTTTSTRGLHYPLNHSAYVQGQPSYYPNQAFTTSSQANGAFTNTVPCDGQLRPATEDDGRIHSIQTLDGFYVCPKCMHMFQKTQSFAGHAKSHYRNETEEERKERHAKHKRKNPSISVSGDGVAAMPESSMTPINLHSTARNGKIAKLENTTEEIGKAKEKDYINSL